MYYLSIDPGEARTGWAAFDEQGQVLEMGKIQGMDNFVDWLEALDPKPKEIIYENYRLNPVINQSFSKQGTVQVIGMLKSFARRNRIILHEQPNTVLKIGLKFCGFYTMYYGRDGVKKKHVDDQISALAHGTYFLQKKGILKSRVARSG